MPADAADVAPRPAAPAPADGAALRLLVMLTTLATGGGERNVVDLLPRLAARGCEVDLCTLTTRRDGPIAADVAAAGIRRVDLGGTRLLDVRAWARLRTLVRSGGYDLVHTHDQYSNILGALLVRPSRVPVVMSRHVLEEPRPRWREAVRAEAVLRAARFGATRVVAVSDAVRVRVAADARLDPARVVTVHNGIDPRRFHGDRAEARRRLGWPAGAPAVTMLAVLRPGKGHEVLLDAVPAVTTAVPGTVVRLVGGGPLHDDLARRAAALGPAVELTGERSDVPDVLAASDVVVLPSWSEALPTVLLEAGAAGRPVVATPVGGAPEIVVDGETGVLVPTGDPAALAGAVVGLLRDPARAAAMGERARARVHARFTLDHQADGLIAVYRDVLAASRR